MEPTYKHPAINDLLKSITGKDRPDTIRNNECVFCEKPVAGFKNNRSKREYAISGMCQTCQDEVFGK